MGRVAEGTSSPRALGAGVSEKKTKPMKYSQKATQRFEMKQTIGSS